MKRVTLVLLLFVVPLGLFAGFEFGPTATLRAPFAINDSLDQFTGIGIEDFTFGADVEVKLGILQIGAMADYRPGGSRIGQYMPASLTTLVTGGLILDLSIVRFGIGVGQTLIIDLAQPGATAVPGGNLGLGLSVKANFDLALGPIVLRLNGITSLDVVRMAVADNALEYMDFKLGLSLLIRLAK